MMMTAAILAAISIEYAPATSNEYYFGQCPNEERWHSPTNWTEWPIAPWQDRINSPVVFDERKVAPIGVVRKCPISGNPFSSRFPRHEDIAWILEACRERWDVSDYSPNYYSRTWNVDYNYFYSKKFFTQPKFDFTNNYCKSIAIPPMVPGSGFLAMSEDEWQDVNNKTEYICNYYGGNFDKLDPLPYVPSANVMSNGLMKLSDYEPLVTAIQGVLTGCVRSAGTFAGISNEVVYSRTGKIGNWSTGSWNNHAYTQRVIDYNDTPYVYTNAYKEFYETQYWKSSIKERNFHPIVWDDRRGYTAISEDAKTGYTQEAMDNTIGGQYWVKFHACTNYLMAGGFNRLNDYQVFIAFDVEEEITDTFEPYSEEKYVVILPYYGSSTVRYGDELKSLYDGDILHDYDVVLELTGDIDSLREPAFLSCGLSWGTGGEASEPEKMEFEDIPNKWNDLAYETDSTTYTKQTIRIRDIYLFHKTIFRMK